MIWLAVLVALLAAAGNNIGKVLQKKGTRGLPLLKLDVKVLYAYLSSPTWTFGLLIDVSGALLMIKAVSEAPVSIVQPVSGCGLAILAVFSHFYLEEVMQKKDWIAVTFAALGTIGIGVSAEDGAKDEVSLWHLALFGALVGSFLGLVDMVAQSSRSSVRRPGGGSSPMSPGVQLYQQRPDVGSEVAAGAQAGVCFGLSAAVCRTGFLLVQDGYPAFCIAAGIAASVALSSSGFYFQTRGLKEGRAVVVSTCAAVAAIVTGVLVGMFALGERLPSGLGAMTLRLLSWGAIIVAIILLLQSNVPTWHDFRSTFRRLGRTASLKREKHPRSSRGGGQGPVGSGSPQTGQVTVAISDTPPKTTPETSNRLHAT
ncbi:hypothetical protein KFL_004600080 [Klebsormidium nitens]|uniref:Probable magnesium transporter n=1 Tax=Klebsormidium nitens TaxID=105231 RepID=A0A1Y1IJJ5_KLENI|nr:hypothetical protein KFL_004600080 [Klebsormidium nitens]|eukprot:GAQ88797.1 hypothetical protein KFL_004600080 [Klebsormidium nitens]